MRAMHETAEKKMSSNITPTYSICLAYESGFGHGLANDSTVNPYPAGSAEFEAYAFGRRKGLDRGGATGAMSSLWRDHESLLSDVAWAVALDGNSELGFRVRAAAAAIARLRWLLRQILDELPQKRDWLNPDIEREARERSALEPATHAAVPNDVRWICPRCTAFNALDATTCAGCGAALDLEQPVFSGNPTPGGGA